MATLDMSGFEEAMKTWYLDGIRDNTMRAKVMLSRLQRNSEAIKGNYAQLSLLRRGNPGVASRDEGGTLPTASYSRHQKGTWGLKSLYGRFAISGKVGRASTPAGRGAFAEALDTQIKSLMEDLPKEHNRMLFGDGTGALAVVATTSSVSTIFVNSIQYMNVEDVIDIRITDSGNTKYLTATIATVSSGTTSPFIAIDKTGTQVTTAESLYKDGSRAKEIFGLQNVVGTTNPASYVGDFGNIDRTTAGGDFWKGNILGNSGTERALTIGLMQEAVMESYIQGNGAISFIIGHPNMFMTYGAKLVPDRRYGGLQKTLDGGFTILEFNGIPFAYDVDCIDNDIYFLDERSIFMFEFEGGYEWMDKDGAILSRVANKDEYEATLVKEANLGCDACNRQVMLDDIKKEL